ncbi:MAG: heme NO-binding domain-containing protein [Bacteroidota bacterium]
MKGIVFTEFLEMVEDKFGFETADNIVSQASLPSEGIYTAVGTYDHMEMVQLVSNLSQESQMEIPTLLQAFGHHLFSRFAAGYGHFFEGVPNAFTFLSKLESYIHIEVKKLYPDAELPRFDIQFLDDQRLEMVYHSDRGFADFAEGLLNGCIEHFDENIEIMRTNLDGSKKVRFVLTQHA